MGTSGVTPIASFHQFCTGNNKNPTPYSGGFSLLTINCSIVKIKFGAKISKKKRTSKFLGFYQVPPQE
jgi:hypothetical protein